MGGTLLRLGVVAGPLLVSIAVSEAPGGRVLDATGDEPIRPRLRDPRPEGHGELDTVLTLLDAVLLGVPLHATCLGWLSGAVVTLFAVAESPAHRARDDGLVDTVTSLPQPR